MSTEKEYRFAIQSNDTPVAEGEGFEPPVNFSTAVFGTVVISRTRPTFHGPLPCGNGLFFIARLYESPESFPQALRRLRIKQPGYLR